MCKSVLIFPSNGSTNRQCVPHLLPAARTAGQKPRPIGGGYPIGRPEAVACDQEGGSGRPCREKGKAVGGARGGRVTTDNRNGTPQPFSGRRRSTGERKIAQVRSCRCEGKGAHMAHGQGGASEREKAQASRHVRAAWTTTIAKRRTWARSPVALVRLALGGILGGKADDDT